MNLRAPANVSEDYRRGYQDCAKAMTELSQVIPTMLQILAKVDYLQQAGQSGGSLDQLTKKIEAQVELFREMKEA